MRQEVRLYRALARTGIDPSGVVAVPSPADRVVEQVDAGRYMPRRIKGSCIGRALG